MTIFHAPSVQSPKAYDLVNLQGAALAARIGGAASATVRGNVRTALQDTGYRYQIHPVETSAGLVEANLTFGFDPLDARRYGYAADNNPATAAANVTALNRAILVATTTTNRHGRHGVDPDRHRLHQSIDPDAQPGTPAGGELLGRSHKGYGGVHDTHTGLERYHGVHGGKSYAERGQHLLVHPAQHQPDST